MTRKTLLMLTGLMAAAGAVAAVAAVGDDDGGPGRHRMHHERGHGGHGGMHGMHGMRLKSLDTDKDGDVTLAEFLKPGEQRFAELDKDGTGFLDQAKLAAHYNARSEAMVERMLKRSDRDGDGKISLAEYLEGGRGHGGRGHGRHHKRWREGAAEDGGASSMRSDATAPADKPADSAAAGDAQATAGGRGWRGEHRGRHGWGRRGGEGGLEGRITSFKGLDENGDGFIDKAEILAGAQDGVAYRVKKAMHTLDANKDGKITRDEFLAPSRQRFVRMDLNDDGKITADDLPPRRRIGWLTK